MLFEYGTAATITQPMIVAGEINHAGSGDWTPAAGDVQISKDEGAMANITTLPTFTNGEWRFDLSDSEMEGAEIYIKIVDQTDPKAVEDNAIRIHTFGNANACIQGDLNDISTFNAASDTVDVGKISGDSTAADNLELDYDGTGFNKSNSTIGTCTTNTDMRGTDSANTTTPPTAAAIRAEIDSNSTQLANIVDGTGWILAQEVGAVSNPQAAAAQYDVTVFSTNYRVLHAGLTSAGVRGTATLSKP